MNENLQELFDHYLPELDSHYSKTDVNLVERPLRAASFIVKNCVVEIKGDTTENFLEKTWFIAFYRCAERWYRDRYGDLLERQLAGGIQSAVQVYEMWFASNIPVRFSEPSGDGETIWVNFPTDVRDDEHPLDWIVEGPNLEKMNSSTKQKLVARVSKVAALVRRIHLNLWVELSSSEQHGNSEHIKTHMAAAARYFADNSEQSAQLAIWEIHFAAEKAFKLWLEQQGLGTFMSHDLIELNSETAVAGSRGLVDPKILARLPSGTEAIRFRYAKLQAPSKNRQREIYDLTLEVIEKVTKQLKRKYHFNQNFSVQLKQPPWRGYEA